ncbi:MAG: hemerythrin domain-containing protein [Deltaproteobacteria bacterium]|nr:hemerythrin domain-containing protein [Deltaproteobacteria bacterium]
MSTTIDLLSEQHQEVLAHLAKTEEALGADARGNAAAALAEYLHHDVVQHFAIEEEALFPIMGRHLGYDHGPLAVMNAEHADFRRLLEGLTRGVETGDVEQQRENAHGLIDLLRGHIAKEDQVLFPMAARLLGPEELGEVDQRAAALRAAS